jgi:hypothetical protein
MELQAVKPSTSANMTVLSYKYSKGYREMDMGERAIVKLLRLYLDCELCFGVPLWEEVCNRTR